jgi:EpsI family protein
MNKLFDRLSPYYPDATTLRLLLLAIVVLIIPAGSYAVHMAMKPPEVEFPNRDFETLPLQLGPWEGERRELDPKIFLATGAKFTIDRVYRDNKAHNATLHIAVFGNPDEGIYHRPYNCYKSNGYAPLSEKDLPLPVSTRQDMTARLMEWQKGQQKLFVVYWYELGPYRLFERWDMFRVRYALFGQNPWPALIKVMIEIPETNEPAEDQKRVSDFASRICQWLDDAGSADASSSAVSP